MLRLVVTLTVLTCSLWGAQSVPGAEDYEGRLRLVELARSKGQLRDAELMLTALQADVERVEGTHPLLALILREQGLLCDDEGRSEDAIRFYERALRILRAQSAASPTALGVLLANLAGARADLGELAEALSQSTEAMQLLQPKNADAADPAYAIALTAHGITLTRMGKQVEALPELRQALDMWQRSGYKDYAQVSLIQEAIGTCLSDLGYGSKAEAAEREALAIRAEHFGPESLSVAASLNNLGVFLARQQRFSESQGSLTAAETIFERFGDHELRRLAKVLGNLAVLYTAQAKNSPKYYNKAEDAYRRQLAIEERAFRPSDVRLAETLELLGEVLYHERKYNEAGQMYGRGLAIQQAASGPADPKTQAAAQRYDILAKKMKLSVR